MELTIHISRIQCPEDFDNSAYDISTITSKLEDALEAEGFSLRREEGLANFRVSVAF